MAWHRHFPSRFTVLLTLLVSLCFVAPGGVAPSVRGGAARGINASAALVQPVVPLAGGRFAATSANWSGYVVTGGRFTSVSATWVQPAVSCSLKPTYASFWVGLDGYGSSTVEQIGTGATCMAGVPWYDAWSEMYPAPPLDFAAVVRPGDHFTAVVTTAGAGVFTLAIADTTRGWVRTVTRHLADAALASAEIIAEAPSGLKVLPLADFGTVGFSSAAVNGWLIGSLSPLRVDMAAGGITKATTSPLHGSDFWVTWEHT